MDEPIEIGEIVAERTGSELVTTIGKKIVLYKRDIDNPKIIL
jgi:RNA-binding protein YhbY